MNKPLHRNKILDIASRSKGFRVQINGKKDEHLRKRMKIFHIQGLVSVNIEKEYLHFRTIKDTYLL